MDKYFANKTVKQEHTHTHTKKTKWKNAIERNNETHRDKNKYSNTTEAIAERYSVKRFRHNRYFPVTFAKVLRTAFLKDIFK